MKAEHQHRQSGHPPGTRSARQLLADPHGAIMVEYLITASTLLIVTALALAGLTAALFADYAVAPVLLQSGVP